MSNLPVLDVLIGVVFMYLVLSLIVTTLQEALATILKWRATNLYAAIERLLESPTGVRQGDYSKLVVEVYRHPLVERLCVKALTDGGSAAEFLKRNRKHLPSYIPSKTFALALLDVLRQKQKLSNAVLDSLSDRDSEPEPGAGGVFKEPPQPGGNDVFAKASEIINALPEGDLKTSLSLLVNDVKLKTGRVDESAAVISARVEGWFNDTMARASGWYKQRAQRLSLAVAAVVVVLTNANTFQVATSLWKDSNLREAVVASAESYHEEQSNPDGTPPETPERAFALLEKSSLPVGWSFSDDAVCAKPFEAGECKLGTWWFPWVFFGWAMTALAVSLGATFWFDVLGKFLQIRGSGSRVSERTGQIVPKKGETVAKATASAEVNE